MNKEPGTLERYAQEVRSGKYPETHPDTVTAKKGEDLYPEKPEPLVGPAPLPEPKRHITRARSIKGSIIMILASFGISASMLYKVFETPVVEPVVSIGDTYEEEAEDFDSHSAAQIHGSPSGYIETTTPLHRTEPPAVTANDVALAQVEAWERVQNELIKEFFASQSKATRALCITMGSKSKCASLGGNAAKAQKLLDKLK